MIIDNKHISEAELLETLFSLKTSVNVLREENTLLKAENDLLQKKNDSLEVKYQMAQHHIANYQRALFGSKSEGFLSETNSFQTALALDIQALADIEIKKGQNINYSRKTVTVTKNANHKGRGLLPAELRREIIRLQPEENTEGLKVIGTDVTEVLECTPVEFYVIRYERVKYAMPGNEGVIMASLPTMPIEKCIAGAYLLATILIDKYVFHMPLHRQLQKFKHFCIDIAKSTINDWVKNSCDLLTPLYEVLVKRVLSSSYLMADETTIRVLDKTKKGTSHRGFYWTYSDPLTNLIFFEYKPARARAGPEETLKNFSGHLQTDGYGAYDYFDKKPGITLMHCMAHARRYFEDSLKNDKVRAEYMLNQFQVLYAVERKARDFNLSHQDRYDLRILESKPILESIHQWLKDNITQVTKKSPIGKAIAYSLKRWDKLCIYTTHGHLEIDNNAIERAIRPVALGRKNYLFAGSHDAAQRAAMIYSFFEICKRKDINPYLWLSETLQKIPDWKANRLEDLLP